jgi:hypothetical protein
MAFYDEEQDEEGQGGQGPQATGAQSSVISSGGGEAVGSGGKPEPFVGISQYINANKPQSEKLANQVAAKVNEKASAVDSALGSAQSSFNQAADSQKVSGDEGLFNAVKTNATSVTSDPSKKSQFDALRNASYTGPQKLEDLDSGNAWGGIQSALQKAKQAKAATGTEEGRMGLIKEVSNNPRQSQGGLVFDNLLLQSNPNSASKLQGAGSSLNDIDQRLAAANTSAAAKSKEIADNNAAVRGQARGAAQTGYQNFTSDLAAREAAKDAEQQTAFENAQKAIDYRNVPDDLLQSLGLKSGQSIYNANLQDFLKRNDTANAKTLATDDDYAKQSALMSLMGDEAVSNPLLNETTDKALMGQVGTGYDYDAPGLNEKINSDRSRLTNDAKLLANFGFSDPGGNIDKWISDMKFLQQNGMLTPEKEQKLNGLLTKYNADRKINSYGSIGGGSPMGTVV